MKKILLLTLTLSCFLFAGCGNTKNIGKTITNEETLKKIDNAEDKINEKNYKSTFRQVANEKTNVSYEIDKKMDFNIDISTESSIEIEKGEDTFYQKRILLNSYGNTTCVGTDWTNDSNSQDCFAACFAHTAKGLCDRVNEGYTYINDELYICKENDGIYQYSKSKLYSFPEQTRKSEISEMNNDPYNLLNNFHGTLLKLIKKGFDSNIFESHKKGNRITIKLVKDFIFGEKDSNTGLLKEKNPILSDYFYSNIRSAAVLNFYPENLDYSITINFKKDGSYSSIDCNYSFNANYLNKYSTIMQTYSSHYPKFKESYAETKIEFNLKEKFTYSNSKIIAPEWTKDVE